MESTSRIIRVPAIALLIAIPVLFLSDHEGVVFLAKLTAAMTIGGTVLAWILLRTGGMSLVRFCFFRISIVGIVILLCLGAAELFLRDLFQDVTSTGDNTSYFTVRWHRNHPANLNRYGYREAALPGDKERGVFRIAIVGDSLTYGQGIPEDRRFTELLERGLNHGKSRFQVFNFGKPGAETVDEIEFLNDAFRIEPDYILLQWFINDVEGRDKHDRPRPYPLIPSVYLRKWLHRHSAFYFLVRTKWEQLQTIVGLTDTYRDSMLRRFSDPGSTDSRRAARELDEFIHRVRSRHIPIGIVLFPNLEDSLASADGYSYDFLMDRVLETCARQRIRCLDLRPVFSSTSPISALWVDRFDSHPGIQANRLAAEAILAAFGPSWTGEADRDEPAPYGQPRPERGTNIPSPTGPSAPGQALSARTR